MFAVSRIILSKCRISSLLIPVISKNMLAVSQLPLLIRSSVKNHDITAFGCDIASFTLQRLLRGSLASICSQQQQQKQQQQLPQNWSPSVLFVYNPLFLSLPSSTLCFLPKDAPCQEKPTIMYRDTAIVCVVITYIESVSAVARIVPCRHLLQAHPKASEIVSDHRTHRTDQQGGA